LTDIVDEFAKSFDELLPAYDFLMGNSSNATPLTGSTMEKTIQNILEGKDEKKPFPLALKPELVERILIHLESGKNVILVGAPGVGKTALAGRILGYRSKLLGKGDPVISVAHADWTRRDLIGGLNLESTKFSRGKMLEAIEDEKLLLIDEFNRADINKAFGEMFYAIEYGKITLSEDEGKIHPSKDNTVDIPEDFQFMGTMNDFDKNLLLTELSYGLITRLAFVDVEPDPNKEEEAVKVQIDDIQNYDKCSDQIGSYYEFVNKVREERMIGVRTSKDVISYLLSAYPYHQNETERWRNLDAAICDYLEPQFDRLNTSLLEHALKCSKSILKDNVPIFNDKLDKKIKEQKLMTGFLLNVSETVEKSAGNTDTGAEISKGSAAAFKAARTRKRNAAAKDAKKKAVARRRKRKAVARRRKRKS